MNKLGPDTIIGIDLGTTAGASLGGQLATHAQPPRCREIQLCQLRIERGQLRVRPLVFRQAFPDRLEHELHHGNAHQVRYQDRLGANLVCQLQREKHIIQRFVRLPVLQLGHTAQLQHLRAILQWGQMREVNAEQ